MIDLSKTPHILIEEENWNKENKEFKFLKKVIVETHELGHANA